MNSEEFRRTGGIPASPAILRAALNHPDIPVDIQAALFDAATKAHNRKGMETCSQMFIDMLNEQGVECLRIVAKRLTWSPKWKGIKSAIHRKNLKNWYLPLVPLSNM